MAGAGYKAFADGDVLTAAQVQTFLQDQAVMRFADSSARTSGLGGSVAEGMVSYLQDTDKVEVYDGSAWVGLGGGFTASTAITATDASWTVPTLADPVVKVTVVGGGASGAAQTADGSAGSASSFACSAGTVTGAGGLATGRSTAAPVAAPNGLSAGNGGHQGLNASDGAGRVHKADGYGGSISIAYLDLTGVSTANVTVGAGGTIATDNAANGGNGVVIVEYRAG